MVNILSGKKNRIAISLFSIHRFSEYIEQSSNQSFLPRRFSKEKSLRDDQQSLVKQQNRLYRIFFWGVPLLVGGLAIYLWNHPQAIDLNKFLNSANFY